MQKQGVLTPREGDFFEQLDYLPEKWGYFAG